MNIRERLQALSDEKNADFVASLTPDVAREKILGVRFPALRALAKELRGTPETEAFLRALPHETFEENNLHAVLISGMRDYDALLAALDAFLPYVDNWSTCDTLRPDAVRKRLPEFERVIEGCLASDQPYTVRFGIEMLMAYYLSSAFDPAQLDKVAAIRSEHYYVRMMQAWYFATALAKQYESALPVLEERKLEKWTHNKTIQKACESYRVSEERKAYLKTLKY
ncbi:MAG: DNA alkylation repair protein [Oscillospiraceae bacterium]|nr:DNA alkylation repair protein [Oscillospiraceae bacterium]